MQPLFIYTALAHSRLGLSPGEFQTLSEEVDAIYHNGALVNFVQPYAALKAANVLGTQEVLRLACTRRVKLVHYVSTLSVFGNETPGSLYGFSEDELPGPTAALGGGYAQSKWVAERMVRTAADRGVPVTVYRPSTVSGHSETGVWNTDDFLCRLVRGCIQLGKAPEEEFTFDIVPVDYVSKAIAHLSRQTSLLGMTFHINNPALLSSKQLIGWANALGYPVQRIPYAQWREAVYTAATRFSDYALYPLLPLFQDDPSREEEHQATQVKRYDHRNAFDALSKVGIPCPRPDEKLCKTYLRYVLANGSQ